MVDNGELNDAGEGDTGAGEPYVDDDGVVDMTLLLTLDGLAKLDAVARGCGEARPGKALPIRIYIGVRFTMVGSSNGVNDDTTAGASRDVAAVNERGAMVV